MSTNTLLEQPSAATTETKKLDDTQRVEPIDMAEAAASLRVLVCLAKAEGTLRPDDKLALQESLDGILHPSIRTLQYLEDEKIDLDEQLLKITSSEARERTYNAAYCLAHMDGECSETKAKLLEHIRTGLKISDEKSTLLGRMYAEARDTFWLEHINPLPNPTEREKKVNDEILKYSILSAVTGAFPLPIFSIVTDLLVISVQTKLIHDIGQYWGHKVDRKAARSLIGGIAGATGMRMAVHSLLNVVPGLGSVVGATSAFATTWALGKAINRYFESNGQLDHAALRKLFYESMEEAKAVYDKSKATIASSMKSREAVLQLLDEDLKAGRITEAEYAKRIEALN